MRVLSLIVGATVLMACQSNQNFQSPTGPTLDGTGRASTLALVPNSEYPGTGRNDGAGAPNSCPSNVPVVLSLSPGVRAIKAETSKIDGLTRGYQWRLTRVDADKAPYQHTKNTNLDEVPEGREVAFDVAALRIEPGLHSMEVRARFRGCRQEFGAWSAPKFFTQPPSENASSRCNFNLQPCRPAVP